MALAIETLEVSSAGNTLYLSLEKLEKQELWKGSARIILNKEFDSRNDSNSRLYLGIRILDP